MSDVQKDIPIEELSKLATKCLIDNFGYFNAMEFISSLIDEGRKMPADYTEWRREHLFEGMTDEEIINDAIDYAKNNHLN